MQIARLGSRYVPTRAAERWGLSGSSGLLGCDLERRRAVNPHRSTGVVVRPREGPVVFALKRCRAAVVRTSRRRDDSDGRYVWDLWRPNA